MAGETFFLYPLLIIQCAMMTSTSTAYEMFDWIKVAQEEDQRRAPVNAIMRYNTNVYIELALYKKSSWKELTHSDKRRVWNFLSGRGSPQERHCAMS